MGERFCPVCPVISYTTACTIGWEIFTVTGPSAGLNGFGVTAFSSLGVIVSISGTKMESLLGSEVVITMVSRYKPVGRPPRDAVTLRVADWPLETIPESGITGAQSGFLVTLKLTDASVPFVRNRSLG